MKPIAYAAALLGLVSVALGHDDPGPSPTESYGCEPHGDHWHCEGLRTTDAVGAATTTPDLAVTTTAPAHDHDDEDDHGDDHDHGHSHSDDGDDDGHGHTDAPGTGVLGPSPTESSGCEPHGDHWHCDAPATATDDSALTTPVTTPATTAPTEEPTAGVDETATAAAARYEVVGLGFAAVAAAAAMVL